MKKYLFYLLLLSPLLGMAGVPIDSIQFSDKVYDSEIHTVQLRLPGLYLAAPILALNTAQALELHFDDFHDGIRYFSFTVQLCNADWTKNNLSQFEYIDGYLDNNISAYKNSFNTTQHYTHYTANLPNENFRLKKSGNYLLLVKEVGGDNDGEIVLTRRFRITENVVDITGEVIRSRNQKYMFTHQQLKFEVNCKGISVDNAFSDIKVVVQQNNRTDNEQTDLQPNFVRENVLTYDGEEVAVFKAGKEFRQMDLRSVRFRTARIDKIIDTLNRVDVFLQPDYIRSFKQYYYEKDLNGSYITEQQETNFPDNEADYAWVHWKMPYSNQINDGHFYIAGTLTNWDTLPQFKMKWNPGTKMYECAAYIKQGFYNYLIGFAENGKTFLDMDITEGNYFETENEYEVFVYYHPFSARYDRLIGVTSFHTMQ